MREEILNTLIGVLQLAAPIVSIAAAIGVTRWLIEKRTKLGGLTRGLRGLTDKATGQAREFGQNRGFYQRREMARQARQGERQRGHVEDYAARVRGTGLRSALLRRRAAGGLAGQVLNANQAGQGRILAAAEDVERKQRHEEAERAARRMKDAGFRGDNEYLRIARANEGDTLESPTGIQMRVTASDRQAAINNLVQQGRTSEVRGLETLAGARGRGGAPQTNLHHMLDHAYEDYGQKLADKAPDLMPDRRTTEGRAAFTDVKPNDVADWHHSTVAAAGGWYAATTDAGGAPLTAGDLDMRQTERDRMLRAFTQATDSPSAKTKLSYDQVARMRDVAHDAFTSRTFDRATIDKVQDMYEALGGTGPRF